MNQCPDFQLCKKLQSLHIIMQLISFPTATTYHWELLAHQLFTTTSAIRLSTDSSLPKDMPFSPADVTVNSYNDNTAPQANELEVAHAVYNN